MNLGVVVGLAVGFLANGLSAQTRGGGGMSTARFVSPTVVASWSSHDNYADGSTTTLLVLWRGTPSWFAKRGREGGSSGGSSSGSGGGGGSYSYQYFSEGGLTFMLEFDYDKKIVKMLNQEISLKDTNVVLVDFVDSANGPTIVGYQWVDPGPPAPPAVPDAAPDPIAGVIRRASQLYDYLQCDLAVTDPLLKVYMPIVCGQMRGERP
jgi:hypothetical protein